MQNIIRYILLTASRDWLFIGVLLLNLAAIAVSLFLGSTALTEKAQMTLAYSAGTTRIILILGITLFICSHIKRGFENKEMTLFLSKPISRNQFIIALWLGYTLVTLMLTLPVIAIITISLTLLPTEAPVTNALYWGTSLIAEASLIGAFAIASAIILRSMVSAALATFAFYTLSRMIGFFLFAAETKAGNISTFSDIGNLILTGISTLLPRLDFYSQTSWLMYPLETVNHMWIYQSCIYIPLLLTLAITDVNRKQF